jgi:hypothetical protein
MMNPCNHTGYEAAPCDVCGYPDPRKLIAKLEAENKRLRGRVREQDEVYDALSVSFDDSKQKYHDLADVSYFKNALLAAANQRVRELEAALTEERQRTRVSEAVIRENEALTVENLFLLDAGKMELEVENKRLREALQAIATGDRSAHEAMLWAREAMREASHDDHAK